MAGTRSDVPLSNDAMTPINLDATLRGSPRGREQAGSPAAPSTAQSIWHVRAVNLGRYLFDLFLLGLAYCFCEMLIWGIAACLYNAQLQFFAAMIVMTFAFICMSGAHWVSAKTQKTYVKWIKPKVDFINLHLGLAFPIPIVMLNDTKVSSREIGIIVANFLFTNFISWLGSFFLSLLVVSIGSKIFWCYSKPEKPVIPPNQLPRPATAAQPRQSGIFEDIPLEDRDPNRNGNDDALAQESAVISPTSDGSTLVQAQAQATGQPPMEQPKWFKSGWWNHPYRALGSGTSIFPIPLAILAFFAFGIPVAAVTRDQRILDTSMIWFSWNVTVRVQKGFRASRYLASQHSLKLAIGTLLNPVMFTVLALVAYTRLKAAIVPGFNVDKVLKKFSSGTPMYSLLMSHSTTKHLDSNPYRYWGGGDFAMSILEYGLFAWGFKLYECHRQLYSMAGFYVTVVSAFMAAANVYLCTLSGRSLGLDPAEALSFSARSVTLALSKPAMSDIGGNGGLNAALVVANGILGQLLYPWILPRLGIKEVVLKAEEDDESAPTPTKPWKETFFSLQDEIKTIATGTAIGINGAAMGVAYLYAVNSRAAPYSALSMTIFGVATVIFTSVDPFQTALIQCASLGLSSAESS